jgi:arylsulfatase A-like enzyme
MKGRSLMPRIRGEKTDWQEEVFVQISEAQTGRAIRTGRWKYSVQVKGPDTEAALQQPGWHTYHEDCLYDLESDPYELVNLIGYESHEPVCALMRERLARRMAHAGEPAAKIIPAPRIDPFQRKVSAAEVRM